MPDKTKESEKPAASAGDQLPLSMIPLQGDTFKAARLVKNARLETMLELHNDPVSGSLQIRTEDIPKSFPNSNKQDQEVINKLAGLHSYDVYSLRANLKALGIEADKRLTELPDSLKSILDQYSLEFTRPMIANIFSDGSIAPDDKNALQKIFRDPDVKRVQERLKRMSEKTGISMAEIPGFLEKYRDMFLATAYYRHNMEALMPELNRFWIWLNAVKGQPDVVASGAASMSVKKVTNWLRNLSTSSRERLNRFRSGFDKFWTDMNPATFERLTREIESNYTSMGAVICGLAVKMQDWSGTFPNNDAGSPASRTKYLMTELEPGLDKLQALENEARAKLGMKPI